MIRMQSSIILALLYFYNVASCAPNNTANTTSATSKAIKNASNVTVNTTLKYETHKNENVTDAPTIVKTYKIRYDDDVIEFSVMSDVHTNPNSIVTYRTKNDNCSVWMSKNQFASMVTQAQDGGYKRDEIFKVKIQDVGPFAFSSKIHGFAAIRPSQVSNFKFLPFRIQDIYPIVNLYEKLLSVRTPNIDRFEMTLNISQGCKTQLNDTTLAKWHQAAQTLSKTIPYGEILKNGTVRIIITALITAISKNKKMEFEDTCGEDEEAELEKYDICLWNKKPEAAHLQYVVSHCCRLQVDVTHDPIQKSTTSTIMTSVKLAPFDDGTSVMGNQPSDEAIVECYDLDSSRYIISHFAYVLSLIAFLFSPLLVKFVPTSPWIGNCAEENEVRRMRAELEDLRVRRTLSVKMKTGDVENGLDLDREKTSPLLQNSIKQNQATPLPDQLRDEDNSLMQVIRKTAAIFSLQAGKNKVFHCQRIHLDPDPEYRFNARLIFSYFTLFHVDNFAVILLRRFIFLFIFWALTGGMAFVCYAYYYEVPESFIIMRFQRHLVKEIITMFYKKEYDDFYYNNEDSPYPSILATMLVFILPLMVTLIHALLLTFILIVPRSVCNNLKWTPTGSFFGKQYRRKKPHVDVMPKSYREHIAMSDQLVLYRAMVTRLSVLFKRKFWLFFWDEIVQGCFGVDDDTVALKLWSIIRCILRLPFAIIMLLLYITPITSILTNLVKYPTKILVPKYHRGRGSLTAVILALAYPITFLGILLTYILILDFVLLYGQAITFLLIDTFRDTKYLPKVIFVLSVLLYINQAFENFEDGYRCLKQTVIDLCQSIHTEAIVTGKVAVTSHNQEPLITVREHGETSIPACIFKAVCKKYKPYKNCVLKTIAEVVVTMLVIGFLFLIATEFQVFQQLGDVGDSFLTILTVSVPRVFGIIKTEGTMVVYQIAKNNNLNAFIRRKVFFIDKKSQ